MYYQNYYYQQPYYYDARAKPSYPPVDVSVFSHSVTALQKIALEAGNVLDKFADRKFSHSLLSAAQIGNQQEVDRLIKSIGSPLPITATYTPTGLLIKIHAQPQDAQCCTLTMYLKWGK
jgi:hypothetical protein